MSLSSEGVLRAPGTRLLVRKGSQQWSGQFGIDYPRHRSTRLELRCKSTTRRGRMNRQY